MQLIFTENQSVKAKVALVALEKKQFFIFIVNIFIGFHAILCEFILMLCACA